MWQRPNTDRKGVKGPVETDVLRAKASAYCALTEHCLFEVGDKLVAWGANEQQKQQVLDWLEDENFISEERYCAAFVADKIRFQGWGKDKIRAALSVKRLPAQRVKEALDAFPEEEYLDKLRSLAQRKSRELTDEEPRQYKAKLLRFLASRGFSFADISKALDGLRPDTDE